MPVRLWSWGCCCGPVLWLRRTHQRLRLPIPTAGCRSLQPIVDGHEHFVGVFGESEGFFERLDVTKASRVSRDSAAQHMERTTFFAMFPAQLYVAADDPQYAMVVQFPGVLPVFQKLVDP